MSRRQEIETQTWRERFFGETVLRMVQHSLVGWLWLGLGVWLVSC